MGKDRKDGKYIKQTDGLFAIIPYIYDKRVDAEVSKRDVLDITNLVKWVDEKNKNLEFKMSYFHALTTVFAKTIYNRPNLNRFVSGHRMYQRSYLSVAFVAKNKMTDDGEEKLITLKVDKNKNALELSKEMSIDIWSTKKSGTNEIDKILKNLSHLPRWLLKIIAKFIKWLDYHGKVPSFLSDGDINFQTLLLSNLGSIGCDSCYHHLNNYGTNSIAITIGIIKKVENKYLVDITSTLDERIADGFYFAKSIKLAQYIIDNPKILEEPLSDKIELDEK